MKDVMIMDEISLGGMVWCVNLSLQEYW